jgi:UDP-hydrolysing UDP-N-acetyl-D-glucosamine 2-epimerase
MAKLRRICVVTGSRAEYGLLHGLLSGIEDEPGLELKLVVTGMHLAPRFGLTVREIEDDGFVIAERVDIGLDGDSPAATARAMGVCVIGMGEAFERLHPAIVVVLGDRFEILAAAQAALVARIPIAHIHGGELTEGAFDDSMRHAITKMAHLHFVAGPAHRARIIQLGEAPDRIFEVGALGLDNIAQLEPLERTALEAEIGFRLGEGFLLVTYHPVTLANDGGRRAVQELLAALDAFPDRQVLVTGVNADPGHDRIGARITEYASARSDRTRVCASLGRRRYLSAMKLCAAVIGNSSSGLIEAPAIGAPSVNLGSRQRGRERAPSVIDCGETRDEIGAAIRKALSPEFRTAFRGAPQAYGTPGAAARIVRVLKSHPLDGVLMKRFHDLGSREAALHGA